MLSDRAFIFHIDIAWGKSLSIVPKVKVISQGQISMSKNGCCGVFVFPKHILLSVIFVTCLKKKKKLDLCHGRMTEKCNYLLL